ncbi:DNA primase [uncultured Porphyromonas sp.]|uniref:DNA primase n=1 Tax=uncultured Porphyromonas sp. TaxID=159274 RepID=UPI0028046B58|nr:DNA primase [uncultured Porphyromonas sp.]
MIDEQTKQLIIDTARIDDVVQDFVHLRRKGSGFVGLCPFHKDRHPSFIVTPSKNICKCFACGAGGTPVSFVMKILNCSFVEALRYLAQKYNIPVPEREMTEEEEQRQSEREALYLANEVAAKFFTEQLLSSEEGLDIALPYFTQRGVRSEAIQTFGLGYSPGDRRALAKYVEAHGYDMESFVATGLLYAPSEGRPSADRYHERVIFPIYNVGGRVVGFGGRTMRKVDKIAKYINSPESIIYDKSRELYGLYQAKRAIAKLDQSIIVEGYLDVIAMHQVGIENVVATSGTALTENQIQLLRRFSRNVLVLFDGDEAGVKAALRSIDMLLAEGMQIKLLVLPDGEDPDEFVSKRSRTEVEEYFAAHAQDFLTFKSELYAQQMASDPQLKTQQMRDILQSIATIPDSLERVVYIQQMSQMYGVAEDLLLQQIKRERFSRGRVYQYAPPAAETPEEVAPEETPQEVSSLDAPMSNEELDLIRLVVRYGERKLKISVQDEEAGEGAEPMVIQVAVANFVYQELKQDDIVIEHPLVKRILNDSNKMMLEELSDSEDDDSKHRCGSFLCNSEVPQVAALAVDLYATPYRLSRKAREELQMPNNDDDDEEVPDEWVREMTFKVLYTYKLAYADERCQQISKQIQTLQEEHPEADYESYQPLLQELSTWQEIRRLLGQFSGQRVVIS